jgi:hypothetical protein
MLDMRFEYGIWDLNESFISNLKSLISDLLFQISIPDA